MLKRMMLASAVLAISVCTINGQNAANNWFFGHGARIQFNPGPIATAVTTIDAGEGSSSISDSSGKPLFYTDGITVWDKNNTPMPHGFGLKGNFSSTQSALIVPCSCDKYFIFTTDAEEDGYSNGLQYSVVEINLNINSGLGDVTTKNVQLLANASEKLAGVSDGSGGFWVVAHKMATNQFFAYHIVAGSDCTLNPQPATISAVGSSYLGGTGGYGQGQMKISPDGTKLAVAGTDFGPTSFIELFNFDKTTGQVTNYGVGGTLVRDANGDMSYGLEFSVTGKKLYVTTVSKNNKIFQYSVLANSLSPRTLVHNYGGSVGDYHVGQLQLAPGGSIYIARQKMDSSTSGALLGETYLDALTTPDSGTGGYVSAAITLANPSQSRFGLPAMVAGDFSCGPTPDLSPCCPPWNTNQLADALVYQGSGSILAPYTLKFQPSAGFENQMQTYIDYLHSRNSNITEITIAWRLHDQTGISSGWGPQVSAPAFTKWTSGGNGNPTISPVTGFFPSFPMQVGTRYAVATGIYLENGQRFFPGTCADATIFVRLQMTTAATRGGSVLEFGDGKKVVKSVPIGGIKQQQR